MMAQTENVLIVPSSWQCGHLYRNRPIIGHDIYIFIILINRGNPGTFLVILEKYHFTYIIKTCMILARCMGNPLSMMDSPHTGWAKIAFMSWRHHNDLCAMRVALDSNYFSKKQHKTHFQILSEAIHSSFKQYIPYVFYFNENFRSILFHRAMVKLYAVLYKYI